MFILVYGKTFPLQVVQGRLFGMGQSKAHQWLHLLLVVRRAALRAWGDAPARPVAALAQRLGVAEAEAAAMVVPPAEPVSPASAPAAAPPPVAPSPLGHDGAERRLERPQDPMEQTRAYRGKKTGHTVNNVRLIKASLTLL